MFAASDTALRRYASGAVERGKVGPDAVDERRAYEPREGYLSIELSEELRIQMRRS